MLKKMPGCMKVILKNRVLILGEQFALPCFEWSHEFSAHVSLLGACLPGLVPHSSSRAIFLSSFFYPQARVLAYVEKTVCFCVESADVEM